MDPEKNSRRMIIVRLFGGLGNQLFQYAAARRLALKNKVPLKLDISSGFEQDLFKRDYSLGNFDIVEEFASPYESFTRIAGSLRRRIARAIAKRQRFENRSYILETSKCYDPRLTALKVTRRVYLDGYWQSEFYFKDIEDTLRRELRFKVEHDSVNLELAKAIRSTESVCIHVRRLHGVPKADDPVPLPVEHPKALYVDPSYYTQAAKRLLDRVSSPHFFVFADYPDWAKENLRLDYPTTFVTHNGNDKDYEDLWLMSLCRHHIVANSTFGWWGAWLGAYAGQLVFAPLKGHAFDIRDLFPPSWEVI